MNRANYHYLLGGLVRLCFSVCLSFIHSFIRWMTILFERWQQLNNIWNSCTIHRMELNSPQRSFLRISNNVSETSQNTFISNWHSLPPPSDLLPSASDSTAWFWRFINLLTYLLTYLHFLVPVAWSFYSIICHLSLIGGSHPRPLLNIFTLQFPRYRLRSKVPSTTVSADTVSLFGFWCIKLCRVIPPIPILIS